MWGIVRHISKVYIYCFNHLIVDIHKIPTQPSGSWTKYDTTITRLDMLLHEHFNYYLLVLYVRFLFFRLQIAIAKMHAIPKTTTTPTPIPA